MCTVKEIIFNKKYLYKNGVQISNIDFFHHQWHYETNKGVKMGKFWGWQVMHGHYSGMGMA